MKTERRDRWIPFAFVGFFLFLAVLEGDFIRIAYQSFTGLVTDEAYATGLDYNEILAAREAEKRLGWTVDGRFEATGPLQGRFHVTFRDRDGRPLEAGLTVTAERLTRLAQILPVTMVEAAPGEWDGVVKLPLAGHWSIRVIAHAGDDKVHRIVDIEVEP